MSGNTTINNNNFIITINKNYPENQNNVRSGSTQKVFRKSANATGSNSRTFISNKIENY